jgi:hypothetical protein
MIDEDVEAAIEKCDGAALCPVKKLLEDETPDQALEHLVQEEAAATGLSPEGIAKKWRDELHKDRPQYLALNVKTKLLIGFKCAEAMDDFSKACTDRDVFIYRLGTDYLLDGHTEGSR